MALYVLHYDDRVLDANSRDGPGQQPVFFFVSSLSFFLRWGNGVGVWLLLQCEAGRNTGKLGSLHTHAHTHTRVDVYNSREKGGLPTGSTRQRTSPPSHVTSASRPIGSPIGSCSRATPQFPSLLDKLECVCVCVCASLYST